MRAVLTAEEESRLKELEGSAASLTAESWCSGSIDFNVKAPFISYYAAKGPEITAEEKPEMRFVTINCHTLF